MNLIEKIVSTYVAPYLKAHVAGLGAGLSVLLSDANGNISNLQHLSGNDWLAALVATGLLGSLTGFVANRPAPADVPAPAPVADVAPAVPAEQDNGDTPPAANA